MSFKDTLGKTLEHEGGWYDGSQPHDPNPTMRGVTQATYDAYRVRVGQPKRSVKLITHGELEDVYRSYWTAVRGDDLPPLTATQVFDHAVNAGPKVAIQCLQRAVGTKDDGILGPLTMKALRAMPDSRVAMGVALARLRFYAGLARSQKHRPSLLAWVTRTLAGSEAAERIV